MPEPMPMRPTQNMAVLNQQNHSVQELKVKLAYNGQVLVLYMGTPLSLDKFHDEIREACRFTQDQPFTVKWIDEEGDPCSINCQRELEESIRLYLLYKDNELNVHVFPSVPSMPGMPCIGEDKSVYRRGARRWKKYYRVNGHKFQAKRFNRRAECYFCQDAIWGLGRQGYRCAECRLAVHKKCHRMVKHPCSGVPMTPVPRSEYSTLQGDRESRGSKDSANKYSSGIDNNGFHDSSPHAEATPDTQEATQAEGAISLDDFNMLKVIGRGSYAKVLLVELKSNQQIYAMKIIRKKMFIEDEDIDWVQTEKSVFETASNHPFLVGLHSCFQTPSRLFFVIEFVPGGDLMYHMQRQRKLNEDHARFYSAEIVLALNFLHQRCIIYRDLKLDNVLLDSEGHIKLTDYGMCKENIGPGDVTGTFCGTPNYIAPEILRGEEYGFTVDYWALGVLMYEMMSGKGPFDIAGAADNPEINSEDYLFQIILERQIRIPRSLSVKSSGVLKGFLNKDARERLGCSGGIEMGIQDIKMHPFFRTVEWELLEMKQVVPPYKPMLESERDLVHFDPNFTDEPVVLTPDDPNEIGRIDQSEFDGFEYVNPLLMSNEDAV